jgi:hypothetical protein
MGPKLSTFACSESSQGELHLSSPYHTQLPACPTLQHRMSWVECLPMVPAAPHCPLGTMAFWGRKPKACGFPCFHSHSQFAHVSLSFCLEFKFFSEQAVCVVLTWGRDFVFHLSKLVLRAFRIHWCKQTKRSTTPKNTCRKYLRASTTKEGCTGFHKVPLGVEKGL